MFWRVRKRLALYRKPVISSLVLRLHEQSRETASKIEAVSTVWKGSDNNVFVKLGA